MLCRMEPQSIAESPQGPRFWVTANLCCRLSDTYLSLALTDLQRPCLLKQRSPTPLRAASDAPPERKE